ncbi:unnamed protein product [Bursaphelenchus xylophilus]|uniref:(pine wood nematode) hypothetical protein n=1 Tax=Bursaphelenchus xylophilus TaxID=6326 RepID=A0A1I7RU73_BURXY|nr:unnamed protein product [Bursaphelenchus xylophilus]CAG9113886.1 unnamed protein product [Bursaphelenchus xylophilus]
MSRFSLRLTLFVAIAVYTFTEIEAGCCCGNCCGCGCCQPCCNCLPCCNPPLLIKLPPTPPKLCPVPCCGCCCCRPCCCCPCGGRKRREIQLERAHKSYKKTSCSKHCKRCVGQEHKKSTKSHPRHTRNAPTERISPKFVVAPAQQSQPQQQCVCNCTC